MEVFRCELSSMPQNQIIQNRRLSPHDSYPNKYAKILQHLMPENEDENNLKPMEEYFDNQLLCQFN